MSEERELLLSSYYLKKSFFHSDEKILERWRQEESLRQLRKEMALLSQDDLNDLKNTTQPEPASSCTAEEQNVQHINNVKAAYRSYMETVRKPRMEVFENTRRSLDEIERKLKDLQKMILDGDARTGKEAKHMSKRRSILSWINDKVKEKYQKAIDKSIKWEEEYGDKLLLIRSIKSNKVVTVAENERAKRERLQEKEEKRQTLENKWRQWQQKRAEKKAKKEEKKQELEAKRRECEEKRAKKKAD
ncbi:hypothetical protein MHYP_G00091590 [Metynnis hypsauchen]